MGDVLVCVRFKTHSLIVHAFIIHMLRLKQRLFPLQDKVEEADCGGTWASGGSWKLFRPAEDVSVPVLLPAEPGVQPGPRSGPLPVQRPLGAPAGPAETPGSADPAARPAGGQWAPSAASSAPHVRRASARSAAVSRTLQILFFCTPTLAALDSLEEIKDRQKNIKTWRTREKERNFSWPSWCETTDCRLNPCGRSFVTEPRTVFVEGFYFPFLGGTWALFITYLFFNMN